MNRVKNYQPNPHNLFPYFTMASTSVSNEPKYGVDRILAEMERKAQADRGTTTKTTSQDTMVDLDNLIDMLETSADRYIFPHKATDMKVDQKMALVQRVQALRKVLGRLDSTAFNMEDKLDPLYRAKAKGVQFYNYYEGCKTTYPLSMAQYVDLFRKNTIGVTVSQLQQRYRKQVRQHRKQHATRLVTVAVQYIPSKSGLSHLAVFGAAIVPLDSGLTRTQAKVEGRIGAYDRQQTNALAIFVNNSNSKTPSGLGKNSKTLRKVVHKLGCFYSDQAYPRILSDNDYPEMNVPEHERINPRLSNDELYTKAWHVSQVEFN